MPTPGPLYGPGSRALQDQFDSRRLADRLVEVTVHDELTERDTALISAQRSFLLATVDADGWPDVSYKGGDVGFVRVIDPTTLVFPNYDGNGMFRSLGNAHDDPRVGLLFIDTSIPFRTRVHGTAEVLVDDPLVASYVGATAVVRVSIARIFPNCGRYIHQGDSVSEFVPRAGHTPPAPSWKRSEQMRAYLPER